MKRFVLESELYLWGVIYTSLTVLLHWRLHFDATIIFYILGVAIGLHLLEIIESFLSLTQSPFRTILAQCIVIVMTFFVLTSSRFPLGKGVVLGLNLHYLFLQMRELKINKTLEKWFTGVNIPVKYSTYLNIVYLVFLLETLLFILI